MSFDAFMKLALLLIAFAVVSSARTVSADKYPSLAAAVAAVRNGGVVLLPVGYRTLLHSQLTIAGADITLRCADRAAIIKAFDGNAVKITGTGILIDGCTLDGQQRDHSGGLLEVNGATDVIIRKTILFNSAGLAVGVYHSSKFKLIESTISGNQGSALFAQDDVNQMEIASNTIDSSSTTHPPGIDTVGVHTYARGGTATGINIHDNKIRHGGDNFAIEIGAFGPGAVPPSGVTVARNDISLATPSNGGISLSTLNSGSVVENVIDANRNHMNIAAIELVSTTAITVNGNIFKNPAPSTAYVVSIDGGSANTLVGNRIEGGIYVGTSREGSPRVDDNAIRQNTLSAPPGSAFPRGLIWLQCNTSNCSLSRNQISDNELKGNNDAVGVNLENDYMGRGGRVEANQVRANRISGLGKETNLQ